MKIKDLGVLENSAMDLLVPSDFAKENLYFINYLGDFYCNSAYHINRDYVDSYLLMYIYSGQLNLQIKAGCFTATKNQVVLLDCHQKHEYFAQGESNFLWFHFKGLASKQYVAYLVQKGIIFNDDFNKIYTNFRKILNISKQINPNEHQLSVYIHSILAQLAPTDEQAGLEYDILKPVFRYIQNNFNENISLETLSGLCNMSLPHFIRIFKQYTHSTPHQYLLLYRLKHATYLLSTTLLSNEEIAYQSGFNSHSHFSRAFKKVNNMTPSEFRKQYA